MSLVPKFIEEVGEVKPCAKCGKPVAWCKTKKGKNYPIHADPELVDEKYGTYVSHYDHCSPSGMGQKDSGGGRQGSPRRSVRTSHPEAPISRLEGWD
ncbi:MAG: hypothetical protein GY838_13565 [bacterium]|nr:hypothetical protein [bacterium]